VPTLKINIKEYGKPAETQVWQAIRSLVKKLNYILIRNKKQKRQKNSCLAASFFHLMAKICRFGGLWSSLLAINHYG